jgi:DNA-binding LacI/PurR family transcriptional regulator
MSSERGRPPTLEHVARLAGVSRATVSRVVNGVDSVDPELREVVQQAIAETGYVPNRAARSLVTRRTGAVALVVSEPEHHNAGGRFTGPVLGDPFFGRVVTGMVSFLRPRGIHPLLMLVDSAEARTDLLGQVRQGEIDGIVLVSIDPQDPLPELLAAAEVPTVLFARPAKDVPISFVDVAHEHGARLAAERLVGHGCTDIGTVSGPLDTPAGKDRLAGFRAAMTAHGVAEVPSVEGDFTQNGGESAMHRLLAQRPGLDGVFVANDQMALGAVAALRDAGRAVPADVAVVGFDDNGIAAACHPPLTTVRQPVEDMAAEMARILTDRLERPGGPPDAVIFQPTLVIRESS